jgi:hypothetical protein
MTAGRPERGSIRVVRGGSAWNDPQNLRSANRDRNEPENQNENQGFRCVRVPGRQRTAIARCAGPILTGQRSGTPRPPVLVGPAADGPGGLLSHTDRGLGELLRTSLRPWSSAQRTRR